MKLAGRDALKYLARPDASRPALLISGADPVRVAQKRREAVEALAGPGADTEMRLETLPASEVRRDPARLGDALRAQGFFPGQRVVVLEDATDGLADPVGAALDGWRPGDAVLVATAGALASKSALRKLIESHPRAVAITLYDDPPTRGEIAADLARAGLTGLPPEALAALAGLASQIDPGDFRQTLDKLALYKLGDPAPVDAADIAACAPATAEADVDDLLALVAGGQSAKVSLMVRRLEGQGVGAVSLCIGAMRHFRALHAACADPGGPTQGIARLRPPVFGPRRDLMLRQAQAWGLARLETAIGVLLETDFALRSASRAPTMAVVERAMIRLAMLAGRGGAEGGR